MTQPVDPDPYTLLEPDGAAIREVLLLLVGEILGETGDPRLLAELGRRLESTGAVSDPDSPEQLIDALTDLMAQVNYVTDRIEEERPERSMLRPPQDDTSPPKDVSGVLVARDVQLGQGPTASSVLGGVLLYPTGVELELDLAWAPSPAELARSTAPVARGRYSTDDGHLDPVKDWWFRLDVPDGRSATAFLVDPEDEEWEEAARDWDLRIYTQSIEKLSSPVVRVRWTCWLPVADLASVRITSGWAAGSIPETSVDIDLSDGE